MDSDSSDILLSTNSTYFLPSFDLGIDYSSSSSQDSNVVDTL